MVTPENGTVVLKSLKTGKTYSISIYSSDVVGAYVTFSLNGVAVAGSQTFINVPDDCVLKDISIVTGQTVSVGAVIQLDDANTGNVITWSNQLTTLATRPDFNLPLRKGAKLTIVQV